MHNFKLQALWSSHNGLTRYACSKIPTYLDSVYSGPKNWVIVFDTAPVLGPVGVGEITAIFLQNTDCFEQACTALQRLQGERGSILGQRPVPWKEDFCQFHRINKGSGPAVFSCTGYVKYLHNTMLAHVITSIAWDCLVG